jgi:hypothetical protein
MLVFMPVLIKMLKYRIRAQDLPNFTIDEDSINDRELAERIIAGIADALGERVEDEVNASEKGVESNPEHSLGIDNKKIHEVNKLFDKLAGKSVASF